MKVYNHISRQVGETVQKRIDHLKTGQKMQDLPEELWHDSFRHYVKEDKDRKGGPNLRMIRLDPQKPSLTVTGFVFNKFVHPYENRFISVREAARLQGFPDDYEILGTLTSTQQQVGNAVPVQLAAALFRQIADHAADGGGIAGDRDLTALSLFCGAGGIDIGAGQAKAPDGKGIAVKVAVDCWKDACDTLQRNFPQVNVRQTDIAGIADPMAFWKEQSGLEEAPDIIFGGPPCQSFSQAGKQKALDDARGGLVFEFIRFLRVLKPMYFVMENVSNLRSIHKGQLYREIASLMSGLGYNVTSGVLCAADYGAPQLRKRLIFIGCRQEAGTISLPEPTHSERPTLYGLPPYVTTGEAFKGLPPLKG